MTVFKMIYCDSSHFYQMNLFSDICIWYKFSFILCVHIFKFFFQILQRIWVSILEILINFIHH
jgi:hypothetical protein